MAAPQTSPIQQWSVQKTKKNDPSAAVQLFWKDTLEWVQIRIATCLRDSLLLAQQPDQPQEYKRLQQHGDDEGTASLPHRKAAPDVQAKPAGQITEKDIIEAEGQITERHISEAMQELPVQPLASGGFTFVKTLQDAPRSHGSVNMMRTPEGGALAVKRITNFWIKSGPDTFKKCFPREIENPWRDMAIIKTLNAMKFSYACDFLGVFGDSTATYIAMTMATEGDLFAWSSSAPAPGRKRESMIGPIMTQICHAVAWLHDMGVAHRDLSLENILWTDTGGGKMSIKIIDYSMAQCSRHGMGFKHGKSAYKAPEMYRRHTYDLFLTDAFALGVVMYAMAWQRYPWKSTAPGKDELFDHARKVGSASLVRQRNTGIYSSPFDQLLEGLLAMESGTRLHLGESCYGMDEGRSVWSTPWLLLNLSECVF